MAVPTDGMESSCYDKEGDETKKIDHENLYFPTRLTLQDMMEPPSGRSIEDQLLQPAGILATANGHNVVLYYWNETLYCSDEECPHAG
jgi:hypothetical protein